MEPVRDSDIIAGLVWAADHGAEVAVMALSNPGYSSALQDAVNYAWEPRCVVVAAAGNDGATTPNYPAGDAKVVGVGATDRTISCGAVRTVERGLPDGPRRRHQGRLRSAAASDSSRDSMSAPRSSGLRPRNLRAVGIRMRAPGTRSVGRVARNADPDWRRRERLRVNMSTLVGDLSSDSSIVPGRSPATVRARFVGPFPSPQPAR
jgi:hypothetical protein